MITGIIVLIVMVCCGLFALSCVIITDRRISHYRGMALCPSRDYWLRGKSLGEKILFVLSTVHPALALIIGFSVLQDYKRYGG